jgi:CRP-like cAMP-binding protein
MPKPAINTLIHPPFNHKLSLYVDKIIRMIRELEKISPEYKSHLIVKRLEKGEFLLQEGAVCKSVWYVKEGLLKSFYRKNEKEIITFFGYPGMILASNQSFIMQEPCRDNIQAITDSTVYAINRESHFLLRDTYPLFLEIDQAINEIYVMWLEERLRLIQFCTARERYAWLMQNEPFLIHQIPVTLLASYLGMTTETLSRIRSTHK